MGQKNARSKRGGNPLCYCLQQTQTQFLFVVFPNVTSREILLSQAATAREKSAKSLRVVEEGNSFFFSLSAVVAVVFEQRTTAEKWHLPPFPPPSEPDAQFFRRVGEANSSPLSSFRCGNQDVFARCQGGFGLVFFSSLDL